jgi:hypothetical protein
MTEPQPAARFLDLLLKSQEMVAAFKKEQASDADASAAKAVSVDTGAFLEWFEGWRLDDSDKLVHQIAAAGPENDTFSINIYRTGPLYWVRALEFDDACYFATEKEAVEYAESNFESFITELAKRRTGKRE